MLRLPTKMVEHGGVLLLPDGDAGSDDGACEWTAWWKLADDGSWL